MFGQLEIAYLGVEVPDPSSLDSFFTDIVGLVPGAPGADGTRTWRNDDKAQRLIVSAGPANDAVLVGVEAIDEAAFEQAVAGLAATGFATTEGTAADLAARHVQRLARVDAPWGMTLEVVLGLQRAEQPFASPLVPGGFYTHGVGFGHIALATNAFDEAVHLLVDGLGFRQSDWIELPMGPDLTIKVAFLHANGRHHTFAFVRAPFEMPQRLHHVMLEVNQRDDVGMAFDRAWASSLPIPNGLGVHDNDRMFSFYVASPAGFAVEIGHGARTVTEDWDDNRPYDRASVWGHQPLRMG